VSACARYVLEVAVLSQVWDGTLKSVAEYCAHWPIWAHTLGCSGGLRCMEFHFTFPACSLHGEIILSYTFMYYIYGTIV
jgi:hypothetical protein